MSEDDLPGPVEPSVDELSFDFPERFEELATAATRVLRETRINRRRADRLIVLGPSRNLVEEVRSWCPRTSRGKAVEFVEAAFALLKERLGDVNGGAIAAAAESM